MQHLDAIRVALLAVIAGAVIYALATGGITLLRIGPADSLSTDDIAWLCEWRMDSCELTVEVDG